MANKNESRKNNDYDRKRREAIAEFGGACGKNGNNGKECDMLMRFHVTISSGAPPEVFVDCLARKGSGKRPVPEGCSDGCHFRTAYLDEQESHPASMSKPTSGPSPQPRQMMVAT